MGIMIESFSFLTNPNINVEKPAGWFKRFSGIVKVFYYVVIFDFNRRSSVGS
ncbi:hypothetical protein JCM15548_13748 [Geofilum rubicundum JCM 15548]|uniref:Uncharacterized protein n=1 Tax=Geofilum rubicundum JCM 15548 TaxID=1236989 RepID=A0A0E9M0R5_9BACT|nr:hypothetical protein JCM15548_13748 [Geofilum rubicundum JCM 15548]